jgi:hypothetical protein
MSELFRRIEERLQELADEAFDPEEAVDSDGSDQAERNGILNALEIVQDEFQKERVHA